MRSLNKKIVFFLSLLISTNVFCQSNPFNASFSLRVDDEGGSKTMLIVAVVSEKNEGKYKLMVDVVGDAIKLSNGNEVFTGKADSAVRQEHYLPLELLKEGAGEVVARLYTFADSMDIDASSKREFVINYTVKKKTSSTGLEIDISDAKERKGSAQTEPVVATPSNPGVLTMNDMKQVVGASPGVPQGPQVTQDNAQKFVINTDRRYNNLFREILFVLSFIILAYLCYRILAKR